MSLLISRQLSVMGRRHIESRYFTPHVFSRHKKKAVQVSSPVFSFDRVAEAIRRFIFIFTRLRAAAGVSARIGRGASAA
jgi:hypothetical protein